MEDKNELDGVHGVLNVRRSRASGLFPLCVEGVVRGAAGALQQASSRMLIISTTS